MKSRKQEMQNYSGLLVVNPFSLYASSRWLMKGGVHCFKVCVVSRCPLQGGVTAWSHRLSRAVRCLKVSVVQEMSIAGRCPFFESVLCLKASAFRDLRCQDEVSVQGLHQRRHFENSYIFSFLPLINVSLFFVYFI